jgi:hypothetical protein
LAEAAILQEFDLKSDEEGGRSRGVDIQEEGIPCEKLSAAS